MNILRMYPDAILPTRATEGSVGLDLYAYLKTESGRPNNMVLPPRTTRVIPIGIKIQPPEGTAAFVCSRSGMAKERSLFVTNSPGVIDPDYRGEVVVLLYNGGHETQWVQHEDRVAQLVLLRVEVPRLIFDVESLPDTERGEKGFGSSGR